MFHHRSDLLLGAFNIYQSKDIMICKDKGRKNVEVAHSVCIPTTTGSMRLPGRCSKNLSGVDLLKPYDLPMILQFGNRAGEAYSGFGYGSQGADALDV